MGLYKYVVIQKLRHNGEIQYLGKYLQFSHRKFICESKVVI